MTTVLTIGTFDVAHWGHFRLLQRAALLGELLVVGVNSDRFVCAYKGAPVQDEDTRVYTLQVLGYWTLLNDGPGRDLIDEVKPSVLAIGSDWAGRDYLGQLDVTQGWLDERDITVAYVPYSQGVSTTELRRRAHELHGSDNLSR